MAKSPAVFNENDPLYRMTSVIGRIVAMGLLWSICSLPLITAGAASCAVLAEFSGPENRQPHALVRTFFRNFRRCFRKATLLWLGVCALLLLLALDLAFYRQIPFRSVWGRYVLPTTLFLLADLAIGVVRFAFYLLAGGDGAPLGRLLLQAGKTALLRPAAWACMVLVDLGLVGFLLSAPYFMFLLPLLPGILAWLHCGLIARRSGDRG